MGENLFSDVLNASPWLEIPLRWCLSALVLLVIWILISIPIALLYQASKEFLDEFIEYVTRFSKAVLLKIKTLWSMRTAPTDSFISLNKFRFAFKDKENEIRKRMSDIRKRIRVIRKRTEFRGKHLASHANKLTEAVDRFSTTRDLYSELEKRTLDGVNGEEANTLTYEAIQQEHKRHRRAVTLLTIGLVFGPALLMLNTQMLNKFFEGNLDGYVFTSPFAFKLSMFIALLFSVLEFFSGVAFYFLGRNSVTSGGQSEQEITLIGYLIIFTVGLLALIESYLYFQLSVTFTDLTAREVIEQGFLENVEAVWLTPFGIVIVTVLTLAGHFFIWGWDELRQGTEIATFERKVRQMRRRMKDLSNNARKIDQQIVKIKDSLQGSGGITGALEREPESLNRVTEEIEIHLVEVSKRAEEERTPFVQVEEREVRHLYYLNEFFWVVTILVTGLFLWLQTDLLELTPFFQGEVSGAFAALIALAEVGALLGASHLLSRRLVLVKDAGINGESEVVVSSRSFFGVAIPVSTVLAILGLTTYLTLLVNENPDWAAFFLLITCTAVMVWIGPNLKSFLSAGWCFIQSVIRLAAVAGLLLLDGFVILTIAIAKSLKVSLYIAAFPIFALYNLVARYRIRPQSSETVS